VHRALGEQDEDGGADIAAFAPPATAPAPTRAAEPEAGAGIEAEAAATGPESAEACLKTGAEGPVPVGGMLMKVFAKLATGLPPLFVEGAALLWAEAEAEPEPAGWWCEWVVHGEVLTCMESARCASDT
jgi:hypothetical protein